MADTKEIFNILEDASNNGTAPSAVAEGDAAAGKTAVDVLVCKDASGNLQHIPLNASSQVPVSFDAGTVQAPQTAVVTVTALDTDTDVVTATLSTSSSYKVNWFEASNNRPSRWELVQNDNASETTLANGWTNSGDYKWNSEGSCIQFTTGATGTQELIIRGQQDSGGFSDMRGNLVITLLP